MLFNRTPFMLQHIMETPNIAKMLIHEGARIDAQTNSLQTPILLAAAIGNDEVDETIIDKWGKC